MKRLSSTIITAIVSSIVTAGMLFTFTLQALALEASTTLTVVNVTKWHDPDCTGYKKHDDIIHSATFSPGVISWTWKPRWPPYDNSVSASI